MREPKRPNQRSVYLDDDTKEALVLFEQSYPLLKFSWIVNAALRDYFQRVSEAGGIDGNLKPFVKQEDGR